MTEGRNDTVASLSSVVLCQDARRKLIELRVLSPSLFKHRITKLIMFDCIGLFFYVHHLLSVITLSRGWRRFVFELFEELKWNEISWKEYDKVYKLFEFINSFLQNDLLKRKKNQQYKNKKTNKETI